MHGNSCRGMGVRLGFSGSFQNVLRLVLVAVLLLLPVTSSGDQTRLVRGGQPFDANTFAFFDPPCSVMGCPGSSPLSNIIVGDMVQWDLEATLAFGFHSTTEGDCGPSGAFNCPLLTGDSLHSTDHSGPSDGPGPSTDHRNVDATGSPHAVNDSEPWHFPLSPTVTNRIRFIKAGTYPYFCTPHQDVMRGTIVVNKANTTTTSSNGTPATSTVGQTVNFTVTVTSSLSGGAPAAVGTPTGTVTITNNGTPVGSASLVSLGSPFLQSRVTVPVSQFPAGTHTNVRAVYNSDTNFNGSTSNALATITVNKANPTVSLTSSSNPSSLGQSVTFTWGLSSAGPEPTGMVTFKNGGVAISGGSNVPISAGQAVFPTTSLPVGSHTITADYSGDANYNAVNASAMTGNPQVVNKATPTVNVSSSANPQFATQPLTFTVVVSGPGGQPTPTGTVTFLDGATPLLPAVTLAAGSANKSAPNLSGGNHTISVSYSGDGNYNSATGNLPNNPQVIQDFTVSATPNPLAGISGQVRTYNGTITSLGNYGGVSGRTVNLSCGNGLTTPPGSGCTFSPSTAVSVTQGGTANFTVNVSSAAAAGTSFNFNIIGRDTTTPFTAGSPLQRQQTVTYNVVGDQVDLELTQLHHNTTPNPVVFGETLQLEATVSNVSAGACTSPPCEATSVALTVSFSAPVSGIVASPGGNCTQGTAPITCTFALINQGSSQAVTLSFPAPLARPLNVTATVTSNDSENTPANNSNLDTIHIRLLPFGFREGQLLMLP